VRFKNKLNHPRTASNLETLLSFWVEQEEVLGEIKEETGAVRDYVDSVMNERGWNEFVHMVADQFVLETTWQTEQHRTRG